MTLGILFAGQGQQFLYMGQDLVKKYPQAKEIYFQAELILGYDVLNLSEEKLNETQYTQPAVFVLNYVLSEVLSIKADYVAGLSLGEYSALVYAGVLNFEDALKTVQARAKIMQSAFTPGETGMMALLKTDFETVEKAIIGLDLAICNYNTPSQIVVGGTSKAIEDSKVLLKNRGIRLAIVLKMSSVSHMYLMNEASKELRVVLENLSYSEPTLNFINNINAEIQTTGFADTLARQISEMTRMYESIKLMLDSGVSEFVEIGPKGSISKFVKEIDKNALITNIYDVEGIELWKNK